MGLPSLLEQPANLGLGITAQYNGLILVKPPSLERRGVLGRNTTIYRSQALVNANSSVNNFSIAQKPHDNEFDLATATILVGLIWRPSSEHTAKR